MSNDFVWVEKYRPKKIDECILPNQMKDTFKALIEKGEISNMILTGDPGMGKTTSAKALCEEIDCDYMVINGGKDRNIDTIRDKIPQFASTRSLKGKPKVIIIDEADGLNSNSFQMAFKFAIEQYSSNCRFILTCNDPSMLIDAVQSRFVVIDFNINNEEKMNLSEQFMGRMMEILDKENIKYDFRDVAKLIMLRAPDWRNIINVCQYYSATGSLSLDDSVWVSDTYLAELIGLLKGKQFKEMRQWVIDNPQINIVKFINDLDPLIENYIKWSALPQAIMILNQYQLNHPVVQNKQLNFAACLTELMSEVTFK